MPNWKKVITSGSDASLNTLNLSGVVNANTDTDKFLVLDSAGNVDFRTGANVLSDIGGASSSTVTTLSSSLAGRVATNESGIATLNGKTLVSGSSQIDHDATTNFVANEHIDHSTVSITAGNGLTGGGTIAASRTINVVSANNGIIVNTDNIQLDTTSTTFTGGVKSKLNSDGVVSGSSQITISQTTGYTTFSSSLATSIASLENEIGGVITPVQAYVDFKAQPQGALPFGAATDLQPIDRWFGVWIAPADGYIDSIYVSPEDTNTPDDMSITMYINGNPGQLSQQALGAAGVNVKYNAGTSFSFSANDRISLWLDKFNNTSDLYAVQVVFRLAN